MLEDCGRYSDITNKSVGLSLYTKCSEFFSEFDSEYQLVECDKNHQWSPKLDHCNRICGEPFPNSIHDQRPCIPSSVKSCSENIPWLLTIKNVKTEFTCEGSLLSTSAVLSSVLCIYDFERNVLYDTYSNVLRTFDPDWDIYLDYYSTVNPIRDVKYPKFPINEILFREYPAIYIFARIGSDRPVCIYPNINFIREYDKIIGITSDDKTIPYGFNSVANVKISNSSTEFFNINLIKRNDCLRLIKNVDANNAFYEIFQRMASYDDLMCVGDPNKPITICPKIMKSAYFAHQKDVKLKFYLGGMLSLGWNATAIECITSNLFPIINLDYYEEFILSTLRNLI